MIQYLRVFLAIAMIFAFSISQTPAQNPEWTSYIQGDEITDLAAEEQTLWVGTNGGLVKLDTTNGNKTFYTNANSVLADNQITAVAIDQDGKKWIGTSYGGLVTYDGSGWKRMDTTNSSLPANDVSQIAFDKDGNKWIATDKGLAKYDGSGWEIFHSGNSPLETDIVTAIAIEGQHTVWIGTDDEGLYKYGGSPSDWSRFTDQNSDLVDNYIYEIAVDQSGTKWIGNGYSLSSYNGSSWTQHSLGGIIANAIIVDASNQKWVATRHDGVKMYDGNEWTTTTSSHSALLSDDVKAIAMDNNDRLWFASGQETLVYYENGSWELSHSVNQTDYPEALGDVNAIAQASNGNKWLGTSMGLVKHDGSNWKLFNTSNTSMPVNAVGDVVVDGSGNVWLAADGLVKYDGTSWDVFTRDNSGLTDNDINALAVGQSDKIWIATEGGLHSFDGSNWTEYNYSNSGLPHNWVISVTIADNGNKWIGTSGGMAKYDGSDWTVYKTSNSGLPGSDVSAIVIDENGNKWIGTKWGFYADPAGIAKFDGSNWTVYNKSNSDIPENDIRSLALDAQGALWVGTDYSGIARFDESVWSNFETANSGLPGLFVKDVLIADNGDKWIGTSNGLAIYTGTGDIDNSGPDLTLQDAVIALNEEGEAQLDTADVLVSASDESGLADTTISNTNFTCADTGDVSIEVSVADIKGNTTTKTAMITVEDNMKPMLTCPENHEFNAGDGGTYTVESGELAFSEINDNCAIDSLVNDFNMENTLENATLESGTTTIKWTVIDQSGNKETCSFDVTVNAASGIQEAQNAIEVYPNPAGNTIKVEHNTIEAQRITLESLSGKTLRTITNPGESTRMSIENLESGVYIIRIQTLKAQRVQKIIKQ